MRVRNLTTLLVALLSLPALSCGPRESVATTLLAGPGGLAVGGPNQSRVFVANRGTDSVQVIELAASLAATDFRASRARYFPYQLPVGAEPTDLASAAGGSTVFVLDQIHATVSAIDADALNVVADANGRRLVAQLGVPAGGAHSIVGEAAPVCQASSQLAAGDCVARAYVTLKALGAIAAVDLRRGSDGTLRMVTDQVVVVGGQPEAIARPLPGTLFVTDAAAQELIRVRLPTSGGGSVGPTVDRFPIGHIAGSVAATSQAVAATRPFYGDVVILAAASGDDTVDTAALTLKDADPTFVSAPQCLRACDDGNDTTCAAAHPADLAICLDAAGYSASPNAAPYGAIMPSGQPQALAALEGSNFSLACTAGATTQQFASGFAVASLNGAVEYIGIDETGQPMLLDSAFCAGPTLPGVGYAKASLGDVLAACPNAPLRRRFACAGAPLPTSHVLGARPDAGALVARGHDNERFGLAWEGVLPLGDGRDGAAQIDANGRVRRRERDAFDFANVELLAPRAAATSAAPLGHLGDVFEVISLPTMSEACLADLAAIDQTETQTCGFERRIVALEPGSNDTPSGLVLDVPLPASCFPNELAYRLRAGDVFLAGRLLTNGQLAEDGLARVGPGDRYGAAESGQSALPLAFVVRNDLETGRTLSACERYRQGGQELDATLAWRSRVGVTASRVSDPARRLQLAGAYDGSGQVVRQLGFLPGGLLFTPASSPGGTRLVVSFAGANSLYIANFVASQLLLGSAQEGASKLFIN